MGSSRPSCSSYIGFQSANVCNPRSPCWCIGTAWPSVCISGGRLPTCVCHWMLTSWQLHSSDIGTCLAQWTNTRHGDCSFAAAGPHVWNSLPTQLQESDITLGQFRRALIAHLFGLYLVTDSCSAEWQCFSCAVYKFVQLLTYFDCPGIVIYVHPPVAERKQSNVLSVHWSDIVTWLTWNDIFYL